MLYFRRLRAWVVCRGVFRIKHSEELMPQPVERYRCPWVDISKSDYVQYNDSERAVPIHDDLRLFEFLLLETAQAGLSWYTVLRKRENYRRAFDEFDPEKVARYGESQVATLLANPGIIRNRQKVLAAVNNARRFLEVQQHFGSFATYMWRFVNGQPIVHEISTVSDYPATSPES